MPDDPVSRRSLLRLDFGWARDAFDAAAPGSRSRRPDTGPAKASLAWRWERGAPALHRAWEPLAPVLCDVAGVGEAVRVLDAACGDGNIALEAAARGALVTGCDTAPGQLNRARGREGADEVEWVTADIEELPFADASFDAVISGYGATLSPNPRRAIRELLRVVMPGGMLVLAAAAPRSLLARVFDMAQEGPGALPPGLPSPALWGRARTATERIEAISPGTEVDVRRHQLRLEFESEGEAWDAYSGPFGLDALSREEFADTIGARSESLARVEIDEPVTVVLARRGW